MNTDDSAKSRAEPGSELARLAGRLATLEQVAGNAIARSGGEKATPLPARQRAAPRCGVNVDPPESPEAAHPSLAWSATPPGDQTALFREILARAPLLAWAVDREGVLLLVEGKKLRSLGWTPGEPVGRTMEEVFRPVPDLLENTRRAVAGESFTATVRFDGSDLSTWHGPLRNAAGEIVGALGIAMDATGEEHHRDEAPGERGLMEEMLHQHEQDRRLIAYEIHDGLLQDATSAEMHLEALLHSGQVPPGPARGQIELTLRLVESAVAEGRRLIGGLEPPVLEQLGVVAAIESLIDAQPPGGPPIKLIVDAEVERPEPLLETTLFRIAQEAITNVKRHSESDRAEVRLSRVENWIRLEICDWGVGFDTARIEGKRLGLRGIRERARLVGGRATIESAPGKGTRVLVDLPLTDPAG